MFVNIFHYLGLFISVTGLMYFINPHEVFAVLFGILGTIVYWLLMEVKNSEKSKKIKMLIISVLAFIGAYVIIPNYFGGIIKSFMIYKWVGIFAFIIATAGTILPLAYELIKNSKTKALGIIYIVLFFIIAFASIYKAPESFSYNQGKTLNNSEVEIIEKALNNYQSIHGIETNEISDKLSKIYQVPDLDLFVVCISLIMAGLTLISFAGKLKEKKDNSKINSEQASTTNK